MSPEKFSGDQPEGVISSDSALEKTEKHISSSDLGLQRAIENPRAFRTELKAILQDLPREEKFTETQREKVREAGDALIGALTLYEEHRDDAALRKAIETFTASINGDQESGTTSEPLEEKIEQKTDAKDFPRELIEAQKRESVAAAFARHFDTSQPSKEKTREKEEEVLSTEQEADEKTRDAFRNPEHAYKTWEQVLVWVQGAVRPDTEKGVRKYLEATLNDILSSIRELQRWKEADDKEQITSTSSRLQDRIASFVDQVKQVKGEDLVSRDSAVEQQKPDELMDKSYEFDVRGGQFDHIPLPNDISLEDTQEAPIQEDAIAAAAAAGAAIGTSAADVPLQSETVLETGQAPSQDLPLAPEVIAEPLSPIDQARKDYIAAQQGLEKQFSGIRGFFNSSRKKHIEAGIKNLSQTVLSDEAALLTELEKRGVAKKDLDTAVGLVRAREVYNVSRATEAERRIEEKRSALRAAGIAPEKEDEELAVFKSKELFDELIVKEQERFLLEKMSGWPPRKVSLVRRGFERYAKMNRYARAGITTALFTGVALGAGAFATAGVAGAAGYGAARFGRAIASGFVAKGASEASGKIYERGRGKKKRAAAAAAENASRVLLRADSVHHALERAEKEYQRSLDIKLKNERTKAMVKGFSGVLAGGLVGGLSERFLSGAGLDAHVSAGAVKTEDVPLKAAPVVPPEPSLRFPSEDEIPLPPDANTETPPPESEIPLPPRVAGEGVYESVASPDTITIEQGGNIWKSAKMLAETHELDSKGFAEAWARSVAMLPDGRIIPLADLNLVHEGDVLSYVAGENGASGHFEFSNTSGVEYGDAMSLPGAQETGEIAREDFLEGFDDDAQKEITERNLVPRAQAFISILDGDPNDAEEVRRVISENFLPYQDLGDVTEESLPTEDVVAPEEPTVPEGKPSRGVFKSEFRPEHPELAVELKKQIAKSLKAIYGRVGEDSSEWKEWQKASARDVLETKTSVPSIKKLQEYVQTLIKETNARPRRAGFESVYDFIQRAEERKLFKVSQAK